MSKWLLQRFAYTERGTFGRLIVSGLDTIYTVEQVWLNNQPRMSCVPIGEYHMSEYHSPSRNMKVILLSNEGLLGAGNANTVPRTYIEIHPANWASELQGCIAPGLALNDSWGVKYSKKAMSLLMGVFEEDTFLEIVNATEGGIPV